MTMLNVVTLPSLTVSSRFHLSKPFLLELLIYIPCPSLFHCFESDVYISFLTTLQKLLLVLMAFLLGCTNPHFLLLLTLFATYSVSVTLLVLFHLKEKTILSFQSPSLLLHLLPILTIKLSLSSFVSVNLKQKHIHTMNSLSQLILFLPFNLAFFLIALPFLLSSILLTPFSVCGAIVISIKL